MYMYLTCHNKYIHYIRHFKWRTLKSWNIFYTDPWLKKSSKKMKNKDFSKKKKKKGKELDVDEEFDKALAAAGLLRKNCLAKENVNTVNNSNNVNKNEKEDAPLYSKCFIFG